MKKLFWKNEIIILVLVKQVFHENNLPSEIIFTIQTPPTFGFLQRLPIGEEYQHDTRDQQHFDIVRPNQAIQSGSQVCPMWAKTLLYTFSQT